MQELTSCQLNTLPYIPKKTISIFEMVLTIINCESLYFPVLREVGIHHTSCFLQCMVKGETGIEILRYMTLYTAIDIFVQQRTIIGMCTLLDDLYGTVPWPFTSQIGYTILRHHDLYRVLIMVFMCHLRHDTADGTVLGRRGCEKDGEVGVAGKVTRAAYTVHHLGTVHVRRVHTPEYIHFNGCIQCDDTEAACKAGVVRYLRGTQDKLVFKEIEIVIELI